MSHLVTWPFLIDVVLPSPNGCHTLSSQMSLMNVRAHCVYRSVSTIGVGTDLKETASVLGSQIYFASHMTVLDISVFGP